MRSKMLAYFSTKNFKQFESIKLDLTNTREYGFNTNNLTRNKKLLKTMLVYGPNASGKSNFGYALFDIVQHFADQQTRPQAYIFYLNADNPDKPATFTYTFLFNRQKVTYEYEKINSITLLSERLTVSDKKVFSWNNITKETDFNNLNIVGLESLNMEYWAREQGASFLRYAINSAIRLKPTSPIKKIFEFARSMLWFRRADDANGFMGLNPAKSQIDDYIISENLVEQLEEFLHKHDVNEKLTVMQRPDGKKNLYFKHKQLLPIFAFDVASSGTIALIVQFYWMNFFKQASFVFIDEFDAFYHHSVAEDIFKYLQSMKIQSIVTTHNTGLLSNRLTRPDCCFGMHSGKLISFADSTDREIREGNNLEKLYKAGEFND